MDNTSYIVDELNYIRERELDNFKIYIRNKLNDIILKQRKIAELQKQIGVIDLQILDDKKELREIQLMQTPLNLLEDRKPV